MSMCVKPGTRQCEFRLGWFLWTPLLVRSKSNAAPLRRETARRSQCCPSRSAAWGRRRATQTVRAAAFAIFGQSPSRRARSRTSCRACEPALDKRNQLTIRCLALVFLCRSFRLPLIRTLRCHRATQQFTKILQPQYDQRLLPVSSDRQGVVVREIAIDYLVSVRGTLALKRSPHVKNVAQHIAPESFA